MLRRLLNSNEISRTRILGIFSNFNSIGNNGHVTYFPLIVEKKENELFEKSIVKQTRFLMERNYIVPLRFHSFQFIVFRTQCSE